MKITIEQLEKIKACNGAINRFYNTKELHDINITNITEIIVTDYNLFKDISWLQSKLKNHFKLKKLIFTNSDGFSYTYTYDERGNQLTYTDSDGKSYTYTYDERGNMLTYVNNSNGYSETYTYDERGNKLTYMDSKGNSVTYTYDEKYNLTGFEYK